MRKEKVEYAWENKQVNVICKILIEAQIYFCKVWWTNMVCSLSIASFDNFLRKF